MIVALTANTAKLVIAKRHDDLCVDFTIQNNSASDVYIMDSPEQTVTDGVLIPAGGGFISKDNWIEDLILESVGTVNVGMLLQVHPAPWGKQK